MKKLIAEKPKQGSLMRNQLVERFEAPYRAIKIKKELFYIEYKSDFNYHSIINMIRFDNIDSSRINDKIKIFPKITKTARRYTVKVINDFLSGNCDLNTDYQMVKLELKNHRFLYIKNNYYKYGDIQLTSTPREFNKDCNNILLFEYNFETDNFGSLFYAIQLALYTNEHTPLSE